MTQLPTEREKLLSHECERLRNKLNALEQKAKAKDELIKELESYIDFIGERLDDLEVFVSTRRYMKCPKHLVEEGIKRRERLNKLRKLSGLTEKQ